MLESDETTPIERIQGESPDPESRIIEELKEPGYFESE